MAVGGSRIGDRGFKGTYLPSITQRDHMVDINIASSSPRSSIIRAEPASASSSTSRASDYVGAIALEDCFAGVASSGLGDPVGEQVTGVAVLRALSGDGQARELGASFASGWHVGRGAGDELEGSWGCGDEGR
jgi:hypothetical protein